MAWVAVDQNGIEFIAENVQEYTTEISIFKSIDLPKGTILKLLGKELTWEDEPVELK